MLFHFKTAAEQGFIDWANLLIGFLLGLVGSFFGILVQMVFEHARRKRDATDEWVSASKYIESELYQQDVSSASLRKLLLSFPLDKWRKMLGPEPFRLLEGVQNALMSLELAASRYSAKLDSDGRLQNALEEASARFQTALTEYSNRVRSDSSSNYQKIIQKESSWKERRRRRKSLRALKADL